MLIRKIVLENFGLFAGKSEFSLVPQHLSQTQRPIILFGGKNGSGKTTLLDAIRLALYGITSLGNRVSQMKYESFLENRIHRNKNETNKNTQAIIGIEFDYVKNGERETLYVERSWFRKNGKGINEVLRILKNDTIINDMTPDLWQGFIEEIIPEGLSDLFFFDGEKIQTIAEDESGNKALADSIKNLLGLDLVEKLDADLSIYKSKVAKSLLVKSDKDNLNKIENNIKTIDADIEFKREELASLNTKIIGIEAEIRKKEKQLALEGNIFAAKRENLIIGKNTFDSTINDLEKKIREECESTFPFSLSTKMTNSLMKQIAKEKDCNRYKILHKQLSKIKREIENSISKEEVNLKNESKDNIMKIINSVIQKNSISPSSFKNFQVIHGLSENEAKQISFWVKDSQESSHPRMEELCKELETANRQRQDIEKKLLSVPDDYQLKPIWEDLSTLNQRLGSVQQREKQFIEEIRTKENELAHLIREKEKLVDKQKDKDKAGNRIKLVDNIQITLNNYFERLKDKKIQQLRHTLADCFNRLSRKGDIIKHIDINPVTFSVTLYDKYENAIPKEELSSGEKQIYAVSILWGLALTSGRPLPIVIDTPLGRLDSDHRNNLINNYFPHASHQVILLSTDTEIDRELFSKLSPHISHCYHLNYDEINNCTVPEEKYFWKEPLNV